MAREAKTVHLAKLISETGAVSPLCARRPRALNLSKESWTIVNSGVTCERCITAHEKRKHELHR